MAFEEVKQRHKTMWGTGEYQNVTETIADIHRLVVDRLAPRPGERWLDLACGTGALAELAAQAGATVTGVDLAPALLETARARAADRGLDIDYQEGDCENLTAIADASFDVVASTCGIMFAPDHGATARELARVTRPGGRIALANWEPEGGLHAMFKMMAPFAPPPPQGAGSPFAWGDEAHVEGLLGRAFELGFEHHVSTLEVPSGEAYWQLFSTSYGPTMAIAAGLDEERREEFHRTWADFFDTQYGVDGGVRHAREYLLVLGTRRES